MLGGVDELGAVATTWLKAVGKDRAVVIRLPDGTKLVGVLRDYWSLEGAMSLRGRLADLESAFKQFAAHPDHAYARVVAVWDPVEENILYFLPLALMFGEAGSVLGFNRGSKFLATVVVRCADLVTTAYFDDYSQL